MKYLEITVYASDRGLEPVCDALSGVGLDQVSIEESHERAFAFLNESAIYWDYADYDKVGVDEPCVKAYIADDANAGGIVANAKAAIQALRDQFAGDDVGSLAVVVNRVDDADWRDCWKAYYKPLCIGERLYVTPRWIDEETPAGRVRLQLDPGVAFGTGAHQTTNMCLRLLENAVHAGDRMLDLGCGSGILSIASVLLDAESAVAVDIDPVAEHVARENALVNGVDNARFRVEIGDLLTDEALQARIAGAYDVVAANIVAGVIVALAPSMRRYCKSGGTLIVSGVIEERESEVANALQKQGFCPEETLRDGGWIAMRLRAE